jgi:hypothetical protein
MSKTTDGRENRSAWEAPERTSAPNSKKLVIVAMLVAAAIAAVLALFVVRKVPTPSQPLPVAQAEAAVEAPGAESVLVEFEKLKGKWLRPDGGYVIELKRLLPDNALEAAYYNPSPIHVGKAKLYKERGFTKVFVELQDVNYPGSTYNLIYDAEIDQLRGVYYQATQQMEFQVSFERLPPGTE